MHTANWVLGFTKKAWNLAYSGIYSSHRFLNSDPIPENRLHAYATHNLRLGYSFKNLETRVMLRNFTNTQYEVIKFYPMPGMQVEAGLMLKISKNLKNNTL